MFKIAINPTQMWRTRLKFSAKSNSGRPHVVLLPFIGHLVCSCHSLENVSPGLISLSERTEVCGGTSCDDLCRGLAETLDPTLACKTFARVLPHPKIGRTCTLKFREGYQFACTAALCSCTNTGDINDIRPRVEQIAQNACQDMSANIPYPTTFKACKQGYSKGLSAAVTGVLELGKQSSVRSNAEDDRRYSNDPAADLDQSGTRQSSQEKSFQPMVEPSAINDFEATISQGEGKTREERSTSWVTAVGTPLEYVDYALVAKERVRSEHRRRGSELKRGPACPVCSG